MTKRSNRALPIVLIILVSLLLGFLSNELWTFVERKVYPIHYEGIIENASAEFHIPKEVIYATIKVESNFDASALSGKGATGLMQILPRTFEWLTGEDMLGENISVSKLAEPEVNIRYGTYYLSYLYRKFDYNWNTAIAAYNGGEGNVSLWLESREHSDTEGNLTDIPFPETRKYVKKVNYAIDAYKRLYFRNI